MHIFAQVYLYKRYIYASINWRYNECTIGKVCVIVAVSKAQQQATNKYIAKAYDRINLTVPKGQKEEIQAHAAARGESVNGFINRAITNQIERDKAEER